MSGSVIGGTDCSALNTGNQGCGIRAGTGKSFGPGFNSNGGGVYASESWNAIVFLLSLIYTDSEMGRDRHCCIFFPSRIHTSRHHSRDTLT